jgi:ribosome-binding protein aMBF1 (putative translation factor)
MWFFVSFDIPDKVCGNPTSIKKILRQGCGRTTRLGVLGVACGLHVLTGPTNNAQSDTHITIPGILPARDLGENVMKEENKNVLNPAGGRARVGGRDLAAQLAGRFHERLHQARQLNGISQSDLAREVWGETTDSRGYTMAKNRDRISSYEKRKSAPSEQSLQVLARFFGLEPHELGPDVSSHKADEDTNAPTFRMRTVDGQPTHVVLEINCITTVAIAAQVIALLTADPDAVGLPA